MKSNDILLVKNIHKKFEGKEILKGLSLTIKEGDFVTITGESGCGKTTLLNILGFLDQKFSGELFFDHKKVEKSKDYFAIRKLHIGYVFQSFYLLDYLNVEENILLPFEYIDELPDKEYLQKLYSRLSLNNILSSKANVLSGGEKQRTAIARALAKKPKILICDEPTGNLDSNNRDFVLNLLRDINTEFNTTVIIVTHDDLIANSGKKRFVLSEGRIYETL